MRLHLPVAAVLAVLGAGWCAAADSTTSPDQPAPTTTDHGQQLSAQSFVDQAASAGMFEVKSSQLALSKGVDAKTREVAQMMVTDHQKANQELMRIAQGKGLMVSQELSGDPKQQLDKLQTATGEDFSKQYLQGQAKGHDDAVALFQRASRDLQDPELKQFATKTLPTLQAHREHVQMLMREQKSSMNSGGDKGGMQGGSQGGGLGSGPGWSSSSTTGSSSTDGVNGSGRGDWSEKSSQTGEQHSGKVSSSPDQGGSQTGTLGSQSDSPANQGSSEQRDWSMKSSGTGASTGERTSGKVGSTPPNDGGTSDAVSDHGDWSQKDQQRSGQDNQGKVGSIQQDGRSLTIDSGTQTGSSNMGGSQSGSGGSQSGSSQPTGKTGVGSGY